MRLSFDDKETFMEALGTPCFNHDHDHDDPSSDPNISTFQVQQSSGTTSIHSRWAVAGDAIQRSSKEELRARLGEE